MFVSFHSFISIINPTVKFVVKNQLLMVLTTGILLVVWLYIYIYPLFSEVPSPGAPNPLGNGHDLRRLGPLQKPERSGCPKGGPTGVPAILMTLH